MTGSPSFPARLARASLLGLLVGAAAGALEMTLRLLGQDDPSVRRRSLELVLYAASWYALAGGVLLVVLGAAWLALRRARGAAPGALGARGAVCARRAATLSVLVLAGTLLAAALGDTSGKLPLAPAPPPAGAPNVLVVCVDTLRSDSLGCYGASAATPAIDALAARGTLFEDVNAPASWTFPSVASLLTSALPARHGCVDFDRAIASDLATLPDALGRAGYECDGLVGNPLLKPAHGFARGFHLYDAYGHDLEGALFLTRAFSKTLRVLELLSYKGRRPILAWQSRFPFVGTRLTAYTLDRDLNERVFEHLDFPGERPRFLYVQYVAPHSPYLEHPLRFLKTQVPFLPEKVAELRARYESSVAYTDQALGELLARLERTGFLERAYVVLTADHGEEFLEHGGFEHGYGLYREALHVPLIVAGPGIVPGARVKEPVRLVDLAPTLLDLAGVARPESFQGRSLRPLLEGSGTLAPEPAWLEVSSRFLTPDAADTQAPQRALRYFGVASGRWKVIRRVDAHGVRQAQEIYDLAQDPGEHFPLPDAPAELGPLLGKLDEFEHQPRESTETELSTDQQEQMRALGYAGDADADGALTPRTRGP